MSVTVRAATAATVTGPADGEFGSPCHWRGRRIRSGDVIIDPAGPGWRRRPGDSAPAESRRLTQAASGSPSQAAAAVSESESLRVTASSTVTARLHAGPARAGHRTLDWLDQNFHRKCCRGKRIFIDPSCSRSGSMCSFFCYLIF